MTEKDTCFFLYLTGRATFQLLKKSVELQLLLNSCNQELPRFQLCKWSFRWRHLSHFVTWYLEFAYKRDLPYWPRKLKELVKLVIYPIKDSVVLIMGMKTLARKHRVRTNDKNKTREIRPLPGKLNVGCGQSWWSQMNTEHVLTGHCKVILFFFLLTR